MKKPYFAFNLTDESQAEILSKFKPLFSQVKCHHITYQREIQEFDTIPNHTKAKVIGYSRNERIECLVVSVDGTHFRPDGKIYHITLSHNEDTQSAYSNVLLSEESFCPVEHFDVDIVPSKN
jgi:hypothetical protein